MLEVARDDVLVELRRRALGYESGPEGEKRQLGRSSDRLLIYLMQIHLKQHKWRGRLMDAARGSLEVIGEEGPRLGLSDEQIRQIREALTKRYYEVSLE